MTTMPSPGLVAVLPCRGVDASQTFYARLGFTCEDGETGYRILAHPDDPHLHPTATVEGWLVAERNPFGLNLYTPNVDALADGFEGETIELGGAETKPWGMREFSLSDPDGTLMRVGWPTRLYLDPRSAR